MNLNSMEKKFCVIVMIHTNLLLQNISLKTSIVSNLKNLDVYHKQRALERYAEELLDYLDEKKTHQFYWEKPVRLRNKPIHPMENDDSLPEKIRGKHFDSWTQLAKELGYGE